MNLKEITTLFDYDKWATDRQLEVAAGLTREQFTQDLRSSHGGVQGTLVHIYGADWIWLQRWLGNSPTTLVKLEEVPTLETLRDRWNALRTESDNFLSKLTDSKLLEPLTYKDTKGNANTQPLQHQLLHKINHSTYHRGQVTTMFRQLGVKPVNTDLIAFYRQINKP